ncbi:maleylpyruvate isomerase family mycothiol-dependent enzyme [Streptomyces monticola]|uniref:Maleylpyruvate isomerase family mycothiol-dependent enzyme n=1 Tax=Streptomyces monticola TaxID=2666263 RepID=A0ABW2JML5_9ACTN
MSLPAGFEADCDTIVRQTALLRSLVRDADLSVPVPACPGWTLGDLLRHVGGAYRWAEEIVRTRAAEPVPDDIVNDVTGYGDKDPEALGEWLTEGAGRLAATLREAGPHPRVWAPAPPRTPLFWSRRMAAESVVHRYDATRALGAPHDLDPSVAVAALEEWMEVSTLPQAVETEEQRRALREPPWTLHIHATDAGDVGAGEWLFDLSGDAISLRRAHEKATVAVRGPAVELLLLMYARRGPEGDGIEVFGDPARLMDWREKTSYWTRKK